MRFGTTVTGIKNGAILFETDVTIDVDYKVDRWGELTWWVDQYSVESTKRIWDDTDKAWRTETYLVAVPDKLADVFDVYLDRKKIEERVIEFLIENDELDRDEGDAEHARAYRGGVL